MTFRLRVALFSHQKSEGHDLEDALNREDNSERCVQVLEHGLVCRRGRVILKIKRRQGLKYKKSAGVSGIEKWNIP